jgi:hypothetical protein
MAGKVDRVKWYVVGGKAPGDNKKSKMSWSPSAFPAVVPVV